MSTYNPDAWVICRLTSKKDGETHHRVFASWYGGYTTGASWKFSSGNEGCSVDGDTFVVPQTSGSTYRLHESNYHMTGYATGVLQKLIEDSAEFVEIVVLDEDEAVAHLRSLIEVV